MTSEPLTPAVDDALSRALSATRYADTLKREAPLARARAIQHLVSQTRTQDDAATLLGMRPGTLSRILTTVTSLGSDQTAPGAKLLGMLKPGSDELREYRSRQSVAPSEIAAIMGRSPYQSRHDLWRRKVAADGTRPLHNASHAAWAWRHQPTLAAQFAADHPSYTVASTGNWVNHERPWQRCWPHRVLLPADHVGAGPVPILSVLTFRTDPEGLGSSWGPDGSEQIPLADYDHHQMLLDTLGLEYGYVVALGQGADHRTYRVGRDEEHIATLRSASLEFLAHVASVTAPSESQ